MTNLFQSPLIDRLIDDPEGDITSVDHVELHDALAELLSYGTPDARLQAALGLTTMRYSLLMEKVPLEWREIRRARYMEKVSCIERRIIDDATNDSALGLKVLERIEPDKWKERKAVDHTTNGKDMPAPILGGLGTE